MTVCVCSSVLLTEGQLSCHISYCRFLACSVPWHDSREVASDGSHIGVMMKTSTSDSVSFLSSELDKLGRFLQLYIKVVFMIQNRYS